MLSRGNNRRTRIVTGTRAPSGRSGAGGLPGPAEQSPPPPPPERRRQPVSGRGEAGSREGAPGVRL